MSSTAVGNAKNLPASAGGEVNPAFLPFWPVTSSCFGFGTRAKNILADGRPSFLRDDDTAGPEEQRRADSPRGQF
jgi:hypothetical protein